MKEILIIATIGFMPCFGFAQATNIFPATGYAGIGTTSPGAGIHVKTPGTSPYIFIDKENSNVESGIAFLKAGTPNFYIFSDNADSDALKIEASGLAGEGDMTPRISLPFINKNILLGMSGGNVGIGTSNPEYKLHVNAENPAIKLSSTSATPSSAIRGNSDTWLFGYNGQPGNEDISIGTMDGTGSRTITFAAGGTEKMKILSDGNIGIGTSTPTEKLSVNGKIRAKEIKVEASPWPDYVFNSSYKLPDLTETERFIRENKHLPEIPSAAEVERDGVNLGELNAKLLKKIEELTLYMIKQDQEVQQMKKEIKALKK